MDDAHACYRGLAGHGTGRIAITGDSAGGNLALVLARITTGQASSHLTAPAAAVVLSPVTDLAMTGLSWESRAVADPYFVRAQAASLISSYLRDADPMDPTASPLYGDLVGLPPIRVQVGDDEVLLDDSLRYAERLRAAKLEVAAHVWVGMPHVFPAALGRLAAAGTCLDDIGAFLRACLQ